MPKIDRFVECWLENGETGERFDEYQTEVKDGKASTTVISEEGKTFTVNVVGGDNDVAYELYIGGTRSASFAWDPDLPEAQNRMLGLQKNENTYEPWIFSENHFEDMAEDDATFEQEIEESRIVIKVSRCEVALIQRPYIEKKPVLKRKIIGERGRGEGLRNCVLYGAEVTKQDGKHKDTFDEDTFSTGHCIATFVFNFRSGDYLQTKGIIPAGGSRRSSTSTPRFATPAPPPEPTPHKKRKLEDITVGEGDDSKEEKIKQLEAKIAKLEGRCIKLCKQKAELSEKMRWLT